jgi:hypothetical protein
MLMIQDDPRVTDIYLGEFRLLCNHCDFRYLAQKSADDDQVAYLVPDDAKLPAAAPVPVALSRRRPR